MRSLIVTVLLFLALLTQACGNTQPAQKAPQSTSHTVTYQATGSKEARIDLTYQNETGGTVQESYIVPWKKDFKMNPGDFTYLSVQINGTGEIACSISVDGVIVKQAKSSGQYVIASCSGSVP